MLILKEGFKESRSSASHGTYSEANYRMDTTANEGTYYCDCEIFCRDAGLLSDMGRDSMDGLEVCY
ncbi:hypothetical protein BT69DRAFT_1276827 [Atractiella rhizophila]|nr:hypothetical protein BT69DRAFT_1276827 [Atractiella rhizophila]